MITTVLLAALSQTPELPPLAQRPVHVRVHLDTAAPGAALYDVSALTRICRAPCGNWVDTYSPHTYEVRADGVTSSPLDFDGLEGDVNVRFTPRREMDIAIAGAGAWLRLDASGAIAAARIVLASVAPTPIRAPSAEQRLIGEKPTRALLEEAGRLAAGDARPISDTRGSADYRRSLVAVLTARALADCCRSLDAGMELA